MQHDPRLEYWDRKEFAGYVRKFYQTQAWRLFSYWEEEDVYQEMYIKFLKVLRKYPDVQTPRHLMGLFKIALQNWAHNCNEKRRLESPLVLMGGVVKEVEEDGGMESYLSQHPGQDYEELTMGIRLKDLPSKLQQVLKRALFGDQLPNRKNESVNQYLCRLVGENPKRVQLGGQLQTALTGVLF